MAFANKSENLIALHLGFWTQMNAENADFLRILPTIPPKSYLLKKKGERPEGFLEKPVGPLKPSGRYVVIPKLFRRYPKSGFSAFIRVLFLRV
jgi:hypothetical protein